MASQSSQSGAIIAGINVTPLVDIMLVLLIIFLVTARLAVVPPKGLPLDLPKSASAETVQLVFAIALYADGKATVNGQLLKSDERVVHAIDLLSQAGITQIAFGVTLTSASTPPAGPSGQ